VPERFRFRSGRRQRRLRHRLHPGLSTLTIETVDDGKEG
jgi:hypothetical protein